MFSSARTPLRTAARVFGLAALVAAAVAGATAQQRLSNLPADLPDCSQLDALHIPMQMNLRASLAMVACGRDPGGEESKELGVERESLVGGNVDTITGAETSPHVTQSEHQIWANGSTVVVTYNDSKTAPANYAGVSYSTDGGATYARIDPSPFATGHGTNFGDPTIVYSKASSTWYASFIATGCGGQGLGTWTSPNGIAWSVGPCAYNAPANAGDRQSMAVDNNPASPFYGRLYMSLNDFSIGGGALRVTRSTDNGATWSAGASVTGSFIRDVQIQVAENGALLLAAMNEGGGGFANRTNVMYRSTDGGLTFAASTIGSSFPPPGDFLGSNAYFAVVAPIWRHMGWGDLATGANNVVLYSYAAGGASGGGTGGSLIPNGGFETGNFTNWTIDGTLSPPTVSTVQKHSGTFAAHLGNDTGPEPLGDSSIYQTITVPASNPGWLTFWWRGFTTDSIAFDWQDAYITNTSGTILATIMHKCQNTSGFIQQGIDMTPYAGQTVRIKFLVHQDAANDDTDMYVDDVTLGSTPIVTDTGDIYTVRSTDNGTTWASPVRMDGGAANRTQWMPSTAGGGRNFFVSWYDRKNTANNDYERYGVISRDGGVTWSQPRRISDMIVPQPTQADPNVQAQYAGDYMRSFYDPATGTFFDGWTDGRIVVGAAGNQQDVETQRFKASAPFDFEGDAKTDRTVFRPSNGVWYNLKSSGPANIVGWGIASDIDVAGDYDGDGKADIAVFRPSGGTWLIVQSKTGAIRVDSWGVSGDIPLAGDIDGDGKDDLVVFRPSAGVWFSKNSNGTFGTTGWGISGDVPMLADYDADGKMDLAIFRPSSGVWYVLKSGGGSIVLGWGVPTDVPLFSDFDGDGKADIGIFRPSSGQWLIVRSTNGSILAVTWGTSGDIPVNGDLDGDGLADFTIFRGSSGVWFTQFGSGGIAGVGWGISGDRPSGRQPGT